MNKYFLFNFSFSIFLDFYLLQNEKENNFGF